MAKTVKGINIPINRAEGDLEVRVEIDNGMITEAWSSGTMFRGFESMMNGRGALDGLVVTPRVCGICSLTHLNAAVAALDSIAGITPPDNGLRLRNLALMVENIQSDIRQAVLMFMVDFANQAAYRNHPMADEALNRYTPLSGSSAVQVFRESKRLLQLVAVIGGQWPHTSFMVPGGVTSMPETSKILQCRMILEGFQAWYEQSVLGCSLDRWQAIESSDQLDEWLDEGASHRDSEVGFLLRFSRLADIHTIGKGPNRYLSYGNFPLPQNTDVHGQDNKLTPAGYCRGTTFFPFHSDNICEDISHSWFNDKDIPLHPFDSKAKPYASGLGGKPYSWIKAPRYDGETVETGPLAEMVVAGKPLFVDLINKTGPNALTRELARLVRPAYLLKPMTIWLGELLSARERSFYRPYNSIPDGQGEGLIQAARGALGHWVKIQDGRITNYQIITPTTWNGSPRDEQGNRGAWEEALIGTPIRDIGNPVEAGHVIRSFDPCLVCAVHCLDKKTGNAVKNSGRYR